MSDSHCSEKKSVYPEYDVSPDKTAYLFNDPFKYLWTIDHIKHIINSGFNINTINDDGQTIFHNTTFNNEKALLYAISEGLHFSLADIYGDTIFHSGYNPRTLRILVNNNKFKLTTKNKKGETIFHKHLKYIRHFTCPDAINTITREGKLVIHSIIDLFENYSFSELFLLIKRLLKIGFNPNNFNIDGNTIFHLFAIYLDESSFVTFLKMGLESGFDPNRQNKHGDTVFHIVSNIDFDIIKKCIDVYGLNIMTMNIFYNTIHDKLWCKYKGKSIPLKLIIETIENEH